MSEQMTLVFPAGSRPVATSEDAADSLSPAFLNRRRRAVLAHLDRCDLGATADEIAAAWGKTHNAVAPRLTELADVGLAKRTTCRRPTRAGRWAFVYFITDAGRQELERVT